MFDDISLNQIKKDTATDCAEAWKIVGKMKLGYLTRAERKKCCAAKSAKAVLAAKAKPDAKIKIKKEPQPITIIAEKEVPKEIIVKVEK